MLFKIFLKTYDKQSILGCNWKTFSFLLLQNLIGQCIERWIHRNTKMICQKSSFSASQPAFAICAVCTSKTQVYLVGVYIRNDKNFLQFWQHSKVFIFYNEVLKNGSWSKKVDYIFARVLTFMHASFKPVNFERFLFIWM